MIPAWAVRVQKQDGEITRQKLIESGTLDTTLRPEPDGPDLLIPATRSPPGTERALFHPVRKHPPLPRHEQVGGIAIMQEADHKGAEQILAARPSTHTVLCSEGPIEGEYRTKNFTFLAGIPTTKTTCIEYGHRFTIDLSTAYFSPRLATERQRIRSSISEGETVCDMFCGVGPFAITVADRAQWVLACDKNPYAIHLLRENLAGNHIRNILPMFGDARSLGSLFPARFDRILMNLPLIAHAFLPVATRIIRPYGTIHLYVLQEREEEYSDVIDECLPGAPVTERYLRSYSAGRWHAVYDIRIDP